MAQAALSKGQDYYTDLPVGEILRRARTHYGRSIADVERDLRIRICQIEAIESGDLEKLPARVYAIGFVRSYAEYLGLDGNNIVHLFKEQFTGKQQQAPELRFPVIAPESRTPPLWLLVLSFIALVGVVIGWNNFNVRDRGMLTDVHDVPQSIKSMSVPVKVLGPLEQGPQQLDATAESPQSELSQNMQAPVVTLSTQLQRPGMTLVVKESSEVKIFNAEGTLLASKVLDVGDKYFIADRDGYIMTLSNVTGVDIVVDGTRVSLIENIAKFTNGVPLDSVALKNIVNPALSQ